MHNELLTIGPLTIYGYGTMIAVGAIAALIAALVTGKKHNMDGDAIFDVCIYSLIGGLFGAKLLYILGHIKEFIADPKSMISTDGFVVYGGVSSVF